MADAMTPLTDADKDAAAGLAPPGVDNRRQETESRVAEISKLLSALEEAAAEGPTSAPLAPPGPVQSTFASPSPPESPPAAEHANPPTPLTTNNATEPARVEAPTVQDLQPQRPSGPPPAPAAPAPSTHENQLAQVRLGMASSLFTALQHKHAATASHSLRVALGCSTWALFKRLDDETRDAVELASLLHDVGKIAIPDSLLSKSAPLDQAESAQLDSHRQAGVQVLACCCSSQRVLDAVVYAGVRFDGVGADDPNAVGDRLPLEARMIAIVDAFDSLTSGQAGAAGVDREAALAQLSDGAGTLFDPILVKQFAELLSHNQDGLTAQVANRWFDELGKRQSELPWHVGNSPPAPAAPSQSAATDGPAQFAQQLLDSMHDGVIFVDGQSKIFQWSKGAERLTGISSSAAQGRRFTPGLLDMCNTAGRRVRDEACPVARALSGGAQLRQRLEILGRQDGHVPVDLHAIPVVDNDGDLLGATVVLYDAESEASLEEKCEALHAEVTKDPMTKAANRAEFDRMQALFMEAHQQAGLPCSLIMTDIDHFKRINDTYGHQAGDEAIITVANLLQEMCRSGDLVARYGGEEFAVLCADCTLADAAARAEQIRRKLAELKHACLGNKSVSASFGVAEMQSGDNPESLLRRADNGLLKAKEQGRNQVVPMGGPMQQPEKKKKWWSFGSRGGQPLHSATLAMEVPMNIAIQKLRGYVGDMNAKIIATRDNHVEIEIAGENVGATRRKGDRPTPFRVEIEFRERHVERSNNIGLAKGRYVESVAHVAIRPRRARNRRHGDQADQARLLLQSFKSYLMAKEVNEAGAEVELAEA